MVFVYIFLRGHNLPGGGDSFRTYSSSCINCSILSKWNEWTEKSRLKFQNDSLIAYGLLIATLTGVI